MCCFECSLLRFVNITILDCFSAPRVTNVQAAIEYIYPLVVDYNAGPRSEKPLKHEDLMNKRKRLANRVHVSQAELDEYREDSDIDSEMDESDFDSDESQD